MSTYRTVGLDAMLTRLSPERRAEVRLKTRQILLEQASLRELRDALGLTQETVAKALTITQENVSRLEGRNDPKISTLAAYVGALGGILELQAVFPDGSKVRLDRASAALRRGGRGRRGRTTAAGG